MLFYQADVPRVQTAIVTASKMQAQQSEGI